MLKRPIPRTGELLPAVGLGTWQTFDVGSSERERAPLRRVLEAWLSQGGRVIDSSPMYGRAEAVAGDLLSGASETAFVATKVWTTGKQEGIEQMEQSFRRLRVARMDLLQVHNLVDVKVHLPTLRAWKEAGKIRYLGVTHYSPSAFDELERWIRSGEIDFVQLPVQPRGSRRGGPPAPRGARHRDRGARDAPVRRGAAAARPRSTRPSGLRPRLRLRELARISC